MEIEVRFEVEHNRSIGRHNIFNTHWFKTHWFQMDVAVLQYIQYISSNFQDFFET